MNEIRMTNGQVAFVDDACASGIDEHVWRVDSNGYAVCWIGEKLTYMHRLVAKAGKGEFVDHKNGSRLDNRRENLRICTHAENMRNRKVSKSNKLGIKGVRFDRATNRYRTEIKVSGRRFNLGTFRTAEAARDAYIAAAKLHHGEFANFG